MKQLFTIFFLAVSITLAQVPELYINEFLASNDTFYADESGDYDDFIEIFNAGTEPVNIGGMYITDDLTDPTQWQIPADNAELTTIPAGGHILLWADKEPEQGALHIKIKLSGSGEQIGLYTSAQEVIDTLTYGEQTTDVTYGRYPDGSDNWQTFSNGSPGFSNKIVPIFINEFLASNDACCTDENGDYDDFIELYNAGGFEVNIADMFITDDLSEPTMWKIPDTDSQATTIPAGGHLILWADKESEQGILHVELKLGSSGEQIGLFTKDTMAIDTLTYTAQNTDTSFGRVIDGASQWVAFSTPSPGAANSSGVVSSVSKNLPGVAEAFKLHQNYPNPFNPSTRINYALAASGKITLAVYDVQGRLVTMLWDGFKPAGSHSITFNAAGLASGVYMVALKTDQITQTKKMLLVR